MRIRKVKCDEARPACNRCISTGRICDGEIGTAGHSAARQRPIEPRPDAAHEPLAVVPTRSSVQTPAFLGLLSPLSFAHRIVSPWAGLTSGLSDHERHGFRHFQVLTAPAMQLMLPCSDWIPVALQMSAQHPAIFHAIAATGTLARALTVLIHPSFPRPVLHELADEAVRQFRKAIRVLREYVDRAVSYSVAIEPILLACLLCVCFEAFRGRKTAAVNHARLGWNIVKDYSTSMATNHSSSTAFFDFLYPQRAGAHALFDDKEHHDSDCCVTHRIAPPNVFSSIKEATDCLNNLVKAAEHFRTELLQLAKAHVAHVARPHALRDEVSFCLAACLSRTVTISDHHRLRLEQLRVAHVQWQRAYTSCYGTLAEIDIETDLMLRIRYFFTNFALATCRDSDEMLTDQFMDDFKDALDCIEQYLTVAKRKMSEKDHSSDDSQSNRSMFFGFSILPALHLVTHKCRVPQLRSHALHILSTAHKQEGLEYSGILAMYARAAAEVEERRGAALAQRRIELGLQPLRSTFPEEARIADCVTTGQGTRGIFRLTCTRYLQEATETKELELTQYEGGAVPLRLISSWTLAI